MDNDDLKQLKRFILEYAKYTFSRDYFISKGETVNIGTLNIKELGSSDDDITSYKITFDRKDGYLVEISGLDESTDYENGEIRPEIIGFWSLGD